MHRALRVGLIVAATTAALFVLWRADPPNAGRANRLVSRDAHAPTLAIPKAKPVGAPASVPTHTLVVRDLADGSVVPNVTLVLDDELSVSDAYGAVRARHLDRPVHLHETAWKLANAVPARHESQHTLWIWRTIPLAGVVRSTSPAVPADLRTVTLQAAFAGPDADAGRPTAPPWNLQWLRAHAVPTDVALTAPTRSGVFRGSIPRIRGFGVRAAAQGCENAWAVLDVDADTTRAHVHLELRPRVVVAGVLRGADGRVLRGAEVRAYVVRRGALHDASQGQLRLELEEAYTAAWLEDADTSVVTSIQRVTTDDQGRFQLSLRTRGEVWLIAYADGHLAKERSIGYVDRDTDGLEVHMARGNDRVLRVFEGGKLLARARFSIADLTLHDVQATRSVVSNARGEITAGWMTPGRDYLIVHKGSARRNREQPRSGYFTWDGSPDIDLSRLSRYRR